MAQTYIAAHCLAAENTDAHPSDGYDSDREALRIALRQRHNGGL